MRLFKKGPPPYQTALAMIGARAGDQVLVIGAVDPDLVAHLAMVTGLNGHTVAVSNSDRTHEHIEAAAKRAGALVEFVHAPTSVVPLGTNRFDVVVIHTRLANHKLPDRPVTISEAIRVLRPAGRVIVIEGEKQEGIFALLPPIIKALPFDDAIALLTDAGATAVRRLADIKGTSYYEARKK